MKLKRITATIIMTILVCVALVGCGFFGEKNDEISSGNVGKIVVNIFYTGEITFKANDFVNSQNGKTTIPKKEPVEVGKDFGGWFLDAECTQPLVEGKKVTGSINIYPLFTPKQMTVLIYDSESEETVYTQKVEYGKKAELINPTKNGRAFDGFYTDEALTDLFDVDTKIENNTRLYIKWTNDVYDVTFDADGGSFENEPPKTYTIIDDYALPIPTKEGYVFSEWRDKDNNSISSFKGLSGNLTLKAVYICSLTEMKPKDEGSVKIEGEKITIYCSHEEQTISIENYFEISQGATASISVDGGEEGATIKVSENNDEIATKEYKCDIKITSEDGKNTQNYVVYVLQYNKNTVTIEYKVDGENYGSIESASVGMTVEPREFDGTKKGYEFVCWTKNEEEFDFTAPLVENIVLVGKFVPINYKIKYQIGNGTADERNPKEYNIESEITLFAPTGLNGNVFNKWYLDAEHENEFNGFTGQTGDITLYAGYTAQAFWNFTSENKEYTFGEEFGQCEVFSVTTEEYPRLLDYLVFRRENSAMVEITDYSSDLSDEFYKGFAKEYSANVTISISRINGLVKITLSGYDSLPSKTSESGTCEQIDFIKYVNTEGRGINAVELPIESKPKIDVETGEQLYFAMEKGYNPNAIYGTVAKQIYDEMIRILYEIIDDEMTDTQKVIAISEYLVKNVAYDNAAYDKFSIGESVSDYKCFYIEGAILDKVAVCDGISKAFTALCAIEGILSIRVSGTMGTENIPHAWNKVFVDLDGDGEKEWSVVDCTAANTLLNIAGSNKVEIINHSFILTTDEFLEENNYSYATEFKGKYVANKAYNIYANFMFDESKKISFVVDNMNELKEILSMLKSYYDSNKTVSVDFCAKRDLIFSSGNTVTNDFANALTEQGLSIDKIKMPQFSVIDNDLCGFALFFMD